MVRHSCCICADSCSFRQALLAIFSAEIVAMFTSFEQHVTGEMRKWRVRGKALRRLGVRHTFHALETLVSCRLRPCSHMERKGYPLKGVTLQSESKDSPLFTWCRVNLPGGATLLGGSPWLCTITKVSSLSTAHWSFCLLTILLTDASEVILVSYLSLSLPLFYSFDVRLNVACRKMGPPTELISSIFPPRA